MSLDEPPEFQRLQFAWTGWLRQPGQQPAPVGVEPRRLQIYRELLFNNVCGFLENAFPVLQSRLPEALWDQLTRRFFAEHHCRTPYFHEIAHEFLGYFSALDWPELAEYSWARELAHFEWVELAAEIAEPSDADFTANEKGDLLTGLPQVSSLAWPLLYRWPVHRMAEAPIEAQAPENYTCLLVYRDQEDHVRLLEISLLTAHLLDALQANALETGRHILEEMAAHQGFADIPSFVRLGLTTLEDLRQAGVILGTKNVVSL